MLNGKRKLTEEVTEVDKRRRQDVLGGEGVTPTTDAELLASVDKGLRDAEQSENGAAVAKSVATRQAEEPRSKWESDNDSDAEGAGAMEVVKPTELAPAAVTVGAFLTGCG
jgi:hypothetical protein